MPNPVAAFTPTTGEQLSRRPRRWRSLFLSDLHLGTTRGRPSIVMDFLNHAQAESLYLVGDIFDHWNPTSRRSTPLRSHRALLARLEEMAAEGTRIVFVPGNHDSIFRRMSGETLGPMQICEETQHRLADGRTLLITHGDHVDPLMAAGSIGSWIGGRADSLVRLAGRGFNLLRTQLGAEPTTWVEEQLIWMNAAIHPHATFANRLTMRARDLGFQGVVCGHYHLPAMASLNGMTYVNCGDWLDHFSALTETAEGVLELVRWPEPAAEATTTRSPVPERGVPVA